MPPRTAEDPLFTAAPPRWAKVGVWVRVSSCVAGCDTEIDGIVMDCSAVPLLILCDKVLGVCVGDALDETV
jgi:hypothetical protein